MSRTVFVHIGAPKTGSTAIQTVFAQNAEALCATGLYYLSGDRNHSERLARCFWAAEDAARLACLRTFSDPEFDQTEERAALADEIDRALPLDLILSAEALVQFTECEFGQLVRFLEARFARLVVIGYAREPQSWVTSSAQQAVKWSGDTLDQLFLSPRVPRFRRQFQRIRERVGQERFLLRPFGGAGFDVVADFAGLIDPDLPGQLGPAPRANEAVSKEAAILLSHINTERPPFLACRHHPFRAFRTVDACRLPGERFQLPRETLEHVADELEADRDWLNAEFGAQRFTAPDLPEQGVDAWYGPMRQALEDFATETVETCRMAQNGRALSMLLRARQSETPHALLSSAAMLATERWTLAQIAEEAVAVAHPDRRNIFAKQRLMRRIEEEPDSLIPGNPFDRPWRQDVPEERMHRKVT